MEGSRQVSPESQDQSTEPADKEGVAEAESYFRFDDIAGQIWHLIMESAADEDLVRENARQSKVVPVQLRLDIEKTGNEPIQLSLAIVEPVDETEDDTVSRTADF